MTDSQVTPRRLAIVGRDFCAVMNHRFSKIQRYFLETDQVQSYQYSEMRVYEMLGPLGKLQATYEVCEGYLRVFVNVESSGPDKSVSEALWTAVVAGLLDEEYYSFGLRTKPLFFFGLFDIDYLVGPFMENEIEVVLPYIQILVERKES